MPVPVAAVPRLIPTRIAAGGREAKTLRGRGKAILEPGARPWEVELGIGKARFLLRRAAAEPAVGFLGIEIVSEYFRVASLRAARRGLSNLLLFQGEALYLCALLPPAFVRALHIYFPDPWPKARHHKRRLLAAENLDLLLRLLEPGGSLFFASDHRAYSRLVIDVLESHPLLRVEHVLAPWFDGPRTNYEAKYLAEGRPICRLVARLSELGATPDRLVHPDARPGPLVAYSGR